MHMGVKIFGFLLLMKGINILQEKHGKILHTSK